MDTFFQYVNSFPMPLWLAMMFAPNHPLTERAGRSSTLFGLGALHYVLAILNAMRRDQETAGEVNVDFMSLDGVQQGLSTRQGALAGWTHMLALDLFTGAWIYRQCKKLNAPHWVRIGALFFTLMTGPFGLLLFLLWRVTAGNGEALEE